MARNQPLAFGAVAVGGLVLVAGITGTAMADVIQGKAHMAQTPSGSARMSGSMVGAINGTKGLVNPFTGGHVTVGRVDMGQDYNLNPGDAIRAIGNSKYVGRIDNWYNGQPFVYFQLLNENGGTTPTTASPYAGRYWYAAEQLIPLPFRPGELIPAGSPIGHYASSGTGIEMGWAASSGQTAAQVAGDINPSSHYSSEGQAWADLMHSLGV